MLRLATTRAFRLSVLATFGLLGLTACAPANVAGTYTAAITSQQNGCNIAGWTQGSMTTGVEFDVTQSGGTATGTVQGPAGIYIGVVLGSNIFTGNVTGGGLDLTLHGNTAMHQGGCTYTVNGEMQANLTGDVLQGSITYTATTNSSPDCGAITNCSSVQDFNGTRPPAAH